MDSSSHPHNSSPQQHVQKNDDPALDRANEHAHGHLHHTAHAEHGRDSTEFTKGTTYGASNIPTQASHDQNVHGRHPTTTLTSTIPDAEKGGFGQLALIAIRFWLAITLRLLFLYVPITIITKPMHLVWNTTAVRFVSFIPERMRTPLGAVVVVGVLVIGAFASPESLDNTRANRAVSLFGLAVM
ncbi:MAG: hypothetical protein Q9210_000304 [Variospora velana]